MVFSKSITAVTAAALFSTIVLAAPACKPSATFELTADAPGTAVDGLRIFGLPAINHLLEMFPSNPESLSQGSAVFYKNDTTHLYIVTQDYAAVDPTAVVPELVTVPAAGDIMFTPAGTTDDFPHFEEYFTATVDLWPPSSHIDFKPGPFLNPGDLGPQGNSPGGWFACYYPTLSEYLVYVGTPYFYKGGDVDYNTTSCIKFQAKINLLDFDLGC